MASALVASAGGTVAPVRAAEPAPKVVASIKPVHGLVAGVMEGVGSPVLLIEGAGSPHSYSLRPSDARALAESDLVFWIGAAMEAFLEKPLTALAGRARVVTLMDAPGLALLPLEGGDQHETGAAEAAAYDPHLWLDPDNAAAIVRTAVSAVSAADPANAPRYAANGDRVLERLADLDAELEGRLAPLRHRPYVVFHDAYRYFEQHYGMRAVASVTLSPERAPGARRLSEVRRRILDDGATCVFAEPQFEPALARTLVEDTPARFAELDPLGTSVPAGPDAYFTLMKNLAEALAGCLEAPE
jgi:zinc transport system substrate-binding protein